MGPVLTLTQEVRSHADHPHLLGSGRLAARVGYVALSLLGLYTLYHFAFLVIWQGLVLLAGVLLARGKRVAVLTIDPARRLAQSMGLASLSHDPQPIPLDAAERFEGHGDAPLFPRSRGLRVRGAQHAAAQREGAAAADLAGQLDRDCRRSGWHHGSRFRLLCQQGARSDLHGDRPHTGNG